MTPRTDKLYEEVWRFTNETDAVDALISMRDLCRELERENAALRELTSTLGAPNHINVPVERWRELRADKERLDFLATLTGSGWACLHLNRKGTNDDWLLTRKQIDRRMATEPKL